MVLIIHIIFEDTTSAFSFWDLWVKEFISSSTCYYIAGGNQGLEREVKNAIDNSNRGDTLFIVFDNIVSDTFDYTEFLLNCEDVCCDYALQLAITDYYCFEELFLSCSTLLDLISVELLSIIFKDINCNKDYIENPVVLSELRKHDLCNLNRETIANVLLSKYTQRIPGDFQVMKKSDVFDTVGKCWVQSCDVIHTL